HSYFFSLHSFRARCSCSVWVFLEFLSFCLGLLFFAPCSSTTASDGFGNGGYDSPAHPGSKPASPPTPYGEIPCVPALPSLLWSSAWRRSLPSRRSSIVCAAHCSRGWIRW